jgi:predicted nucleotidyltransferase
VNDVNLELVELAAEALGKLREQVVFLGGATIGLWITDEAAPEVRATDDVDVIVAVSSRLRYAKFEEQLRGRGFEHDTESGVICRFRHTPTGLTLDAMPENPAILGFDNRWQRESIPHAVKRALPSGIEIRLVPPPYLLATKLEAFKGRGKGDFLGSRDFGDIVALIDGREELPDEVGSAPEKLRRYVSQELRRLRRHSYFDSGVSGALLPDDASQVRAQLVVDPRIEAIIATG